MCVGGCRITTDSISFLPFLLVIIVNMASIAATEAWTALTKDEFDTNWILFGFQKGSIEVRRHHVPSLFVSLSVLVHHWRV